MIANISKLKCAIISVFLVAICSYSNAFNLDTSFPIYYSGRKGSYFGYTTALHKNKWGYLALIGAPKANTTAFPDPVYQPGTLFRCNITDYASAKDCKEILLMKEGATEIQPRYEIAYEDKKDNMWLGVSLSIRPSSKDNDIVTCGHRWINKYHRAVHLVNGVCYVINGNLEENSIKKLLPLTQRALQYGRDADGATEYNHALGQAGMSLSFTEDGSHLVLGAPGIWSWTGSIVNYGENLGYNNDIYRDPVVPHPPYEINFNAYFGYSVTTGRFFESKKELFAVGAPKDGYNGKVYIIRQIGNNMRIQQRKQGLQMGDYFGASVLGVNLNGDQYTDLLVGAPLNSLESAGDEGKVYVYISNGKDLQKYIELRGDQKASARFGTALANIGDLNQDGFSDIAVGAPYEDGKGAVYIYHGFSLGVRSKYTQKIEASPLSSKLSGFGIHISRGMDIDNNGYPDILIGSYASSDAVLLRSRPIIRLYPELTFMPKRININQTTCDVAGATLTCVRIDACLRYTGKHVSSSLEFRFTLSIQEQNRRSFFTEKRARKTELNMVLDIGTKTCAQFQLYLNDDIKDVVTPIEVQFSHKLVRPKGTENIFDKKFPIYHPQSLTNVTSEIPFQTGCGKDNECHADLVVSTTRFEPKTGRYLTLGMFTSISVLISVKNIKEPAYLSELLISLPPELPSIKHDYFCDSGNQQNNVSLVCSLGNPLGNGSQIDVNIKLDATKIPPHTKYLEIICQAVTISNETNPDDNIEIVPLHLETKADIGITGLSSDNQIMYDGIREASPTITHTYTVRSYASPLGNIDIILNIPYIFSTPNGKKQFLSFSALEADSETSLSVPTVCNDASLNLKDIKPTSKNRANGAKGDRELLVEDSDNSSALQSEDSIGPPDNLIQTSDVEIKNSFPENENVSSAAKARGYITVNCDREDVECMSIRCSAGAFLSRRQFAQISVGFLLNFTVLDDYLGPWYQIDFITVGNIRVDDAKVNRVHNHPDSVEIKTKVLHEGPPPQEELSPWILFVSVGVGVALLLIILIILIKIGFFRRKEKDKMKELLYDTKQGETNPQEIDDTAVLPQ